MVLNSLKFENKQIKQSKQQFLLSYIVSQAYKMN